MKIAGKIIVITLICSMWSLVSAQSNVKWRGSDGWGVSGAYASLFKTWNTQTISGEITKIDTMTPMMDMAYGIQLVVKTTSEEIPVHLGPAWFLIHQDMNITMKDIVEVKGARVAINGKPVVIASEVRRKDRVLQLRDEDGIPYWCAWRVKK